MSDDHSWYPLGESGRAGQRESPPCDVDRVRWQQVPHSAIWRPADEGAEPSAVQTAQASSRVPRAREASRDVARELARDIAVARPAIRPGSRQPPPHGRTGWTGSRRAKILRWTAMSVCTVLVAVLGIAAYLVEALSDNIQHEALLQPGETQAAEPVDGFGHSPMNILIIGSDTRDTAADCAIGGDCGTGANADVEMVVHLSADRSNATIMSIPRDTMVVMPSCVDQSANTATQGGYESQITTSLQWGPSCTQKAVHDLTGLTIDHYMMVDFSGVESLSEALGGVQVCVTDKMYDKDSGLRLNAGENTVEGLSALQFVRTRHGFYDGSDLGREKAQHYFLAGMIREVRQNMNLSDAGTLVSVANASTKALTVDDGLSGLTNLMSLATTMNKVPTNRISFVTMPWGLDPKNLNRVLVAQPYANQMFRAIGQDVPYSTRSGAPAAPAAAPATDAASAAASGTAIGPGTSPVGAPVDVSTVRVRVENGSGIPGRAAAVASSLTDGGFRLAEVNGNAPALSATTLYYPADRSDSAAAVADALGLPSSALTESSSYAEVTLVIGSDWPSGSSYSAGVRSGPSPTAAASAPAISSLENASASGGCVPVNPADIVR